MLLNFDATTVTPQQGGGRHPPGNKFPFEITAVAAKQVKDKDAGYFEVEFTSPAGTIKNIYNIWNENETARKIAQQELSALCHATGRFRLATGEELKGARGLMDVGFQKGHEPSAEKPEGGYVELKKVYDVNGNEPGKVAAQPQGQQQQPQGNQQGAATTWGNGGQPQQVNGGGNQPNVQSGWNANANNPQTQAATGWSQGAGQAHPPWKAS